MLLIIILYIGILHYFESGYMNSIGITNNGALTLNSRIILVKEILQSWQSNHFPREWQKTNLKLTSESVFNLIKQSQYLEPEMSKEW